MSLADQGDWRTGKPATLGIAPDTILIYTTRGSAEGFQLDAEM